MTLFPHSRPPLRVAAQAALLLLTPLLTHAQTWLFDFGGGNTTTEPDPAWNNVTGVGTATPGTPAAELANIVSTDNVAGNLKLVTLARFNGVNESGTLESTLYPPNATRDNLFGNTENFGAGTNFFPSFKFTGLDPQAGYKFHFYASRTGVADNRETLYTLTGLTTESTTFNPANNIDEEAIVSGIKPTAGGEITILLGPGENNNNSNHFTYLGVLKLELEAPPQTPVVFTDEPDDITVLAGRPATFTAAVQTSPPTTIQWKQDGNPIDGANQLSYTLPAASLDLNNAKFSVTVSNLQFSATSRAAILHVTTDGTPPTVVSSASFGPADFRITFNEDMDEISAAEIINYTVTSGGGAVSVVEAVLQPDHRTVILAMLEEMTGSATVVINGVSDINGNDVAANTTVSASVPVADGLSLLLDFGTGGTTTERGAGNDDPLNVWNNITEAVAQTDGGTLPDLVKNDGTQTEIFLNVISRFNGANTNGTLASTVYAADATRDTLYGNTEVFNDLTNITPVFSFTGLDSSLAYDFTFYASRMDVGDNRETRYTVTGSTNGEALLNVANNVNTTVSVTNIRPGTEGEITISLTPGPANNNGNHFIYLGALKLTPHAPPVPGPIVFTDEPDDTLVLAGLPVTFTAAVQGAQPITAQWKKNGAPITGATDLTYTIPSATVDLDGAKYSVTASNAVNSLTSREATLRVTTDAVPPTVVSTSSTGPQKLSITFSEDVDTVTAQIASNYVVDTGSITVLSAVLQADRRTVLLTTQEEMSGTVSVSITGVKDVNGNTIAANTQASISIATADGLSFLLDFGTAATTTESGPGPDDPVFTWNNITESIAQTDGGTLEGLLRNNGDSSGITLEIVSRFNAANTNGTTASSLYPQDATRDSLYGNTEAFNNLTGITPVFRLLNLDPSLTYDFSFYASRTGVSDNRDTLYTVTGTNNGSALLGVANNIDTVAGVTGIQPSASGAISIALTPGPNNNNANHFVYLGALKLTPKAAGGSPPVMLTLVVANGNITLSWTGTGTLEWSTSLTGQWNPYNPAPTPPFTEPVIPGSKKFYRVRP